MSKIADTVESKRPQDELIQRLRDTLSGYLDPSQINECIRAYEFGADAHQGQYRKSGEAYICHPVAVAITLAEMRMDASGIMAAILHDVIEDTPITKKELAKQFSPEVADLVDGVTKLTKIDGKSQTRAEAQAENVRKMFLVWGVVYAIMPVRLV